MRRTGRRVAGIAKPKGFTLIELMIVLAIIGVLVMAGVPYLQNYLIRARVVEGLGAAAGAKTLVNENAMHGAPFSNGWEAPAATDNVNAVTIDNASGAVTVAYTQRAGDGAIVLVPTARAANGDGQALTVGQTPQGQIVWVCYAQGKQNAPGGATLPAKYAPAECRDATPAT
ncbi:Fimbrial protein [Pandoraea terrae]|uniref:Fimbrial protein n=2 Tax=Pandoraea terrae TaxID=1537710 RepID=A0A5E4TQC5_9BURK|nr:Fimbrial protein [Pandoraea terrae]